MITYFWTGQSESVLLLGDPLQGDVTIAFLKEKQRKPGFPRVSMMRIKFISG
jgi:hypothetical protein